MDFHRLDSASAYQKIDRTQSTSIDSRENDFIDLNHNHYYDIPIVNNYHLSDKGINPPTFDGSTDPMFWIQKYDMYSGAYRWDEEHKIAMLCQALKGPAMSYFMSLSNSANLSFQEICIGLKKQFTSRNENGLKIILERKQ